MALLKMEPLMLAVAVAGERQRGSVKVGTGPHSSQQLFGVNLVFLWARVARNFLGSAA